MWLVRSLGLFSKIHLLASENAWAWCLIIFLRERYPSKIRRGESITPTTACLPTASPLHLQHILPPVIVEASSRKQRPQFIRIRRHIYTLFAVLQNFSYLFKFLLGITASDSGEYRKSSEIYNRVNTWTPKIYKFSRLIPEHFLEEKV